MLVTQRMSNSDSSNIAQPGVNQEKIAALATLTIVGDLGEMALVLQRWDCYSKIYVTKHRAFCKHITFRLGEYQRFHSPTTCKWLLRPLVGF